MDWSKNQIKEFQQDLLSWYDDNKKPLPWRKTTEPYKIWISEIMSQQTQVETVMPYYERFMKKYPTIETLAQADDAELLKLWEGLGYYSRARNLKIAAQEVVDKYNGKFPDNLADILSLKGIGPYTAAAIASISFGLAEPAIDGNLMRVTSRLFELDCDISKSSSRKIFDGYLRKLISKKRPGDFNQALMDLGSLVCSPKSPKCEACPLLNYCAAAASGKQLNYPVKTKKIKQKDLYFTAFALENSLGEYYLEKRPSKGLLADMWTFPLTELPAADFEKMITDGSVSKNIVIPELPESISKMEYVANFTHVFSHQKWHLAIIKLKPEETFEVADELLSEDKMWVHFDPKVLTENGQPKVSRSQIPLAGPQVKMFEILDKKNKKLIC
ncbi:Adenine glycosylase [Lactococcus lactis subsp. lactis NCDO 2118]|uniref:Adenine DNA glycosylase n=1 Tax=Lactococcus lactis subsp. lactis NCDO 2118 TaxID=1117941 RepID=A0ABC8A593_LACLL|nr:A/G-specific adenine glycosylase [Lactococcus lactis]AII12338.1 Adenine glycosylase [Lactococcus lactis subsp. lactis NCDO 2118]